MLLFPLRQIILRLEGIIISSPKEMGPQYLEQRNKLDSFYDFGFTFLQSFNHWGPLLYLLQPMAWSVRSHIELEKNIGGMIVKIYELG